ncbi:HAD family hydrolase [Maribacter sp. 2307ULW6-5]|uniref:HAD family hydrolase n=1 Tax=Maribacter sp. 2307ULW6-5 TaxID=3386275 RepID=UPI0039BC8005
MEVKVDEQTVVVFDLDDTLYNELDFLKSAYFEMASSLQKDKPLLLYAEMFSRYRDGQNVFASLAEKYHRPIAYFVERYRAHVPNIKPFDGVVPLFRDIREKRGKIAVVTDGRSSTQRNKLKALGIEPFIDALVVSEEIGSEKPSKANFMKIEELLPGTSYLYVADNFKKDFLAPKAMGWKTIGVLDNGKNIHFNIHQYLSRELYLPLYLIKDFNDLFIR